ncbi:hypothetical protein HDV05_001724 [Chytridiales sp. JEL 0842]|nr:hypothetical protein HDV05_001724 [Chytridiales sp. JEL 0842]
MAKNLAPIGVYPLFGIMAVAVGGCSWYILRLARGPDVVWAKKSNPTPWLTVKQDQTTKLYDPYGRFKESWTRGGL